MTKIQWEITADEVAPSGVRVVRVDLFDELGGHIGAVECEWEGRSPTDRMLPVDPSQALTKMQEALNVAFERAIKPKPAPPPSASTGGSLPETHQDWHEPAMSNERKEKLHWVDFFGTGCTNKRAPKEWAVKVLEELERRGEDAGKEEVEGILMEFDWHRDFGLEE